ncbi:MAG: PorV/PorQ family protein [Saprospiraceae bacterium]
MNIKFYISILAIIVCGSLMYGGNPDRQGQAGASELLMNPWGRSAGLHSMSTSSATGVEAMRINVAGISRINRFEIGVSNNRLYSGSDLNLNSFGMVTRLGETGALGVEFSSLNFGDIPITTNLQPAGTGGTFSPGFFQLGIGYGFTYANKISVGLLFRGISESVIDVSAFGWAVDAGVQYVSGEKDNFKLGIALRNVGSPMQFGGEGLSVRRPNPDQAYGSYQINYDYRAASFELPSLLNLGVSYDIYFKEDLFLRTLGNFTSNAFSQDQVGVGAELSFKNLAILRGAYKTDLGENIDGDNIYTGFAGGFTANLPFNGNNISFDYAYRSTNPYKGTHNFTIVYSL